MSLRTLVLAAVGPFALLVLSPSSGMALPIADATCRKSLDVGAVGVSGAVFKNEAKCYRARMAGLIPGTVNCADTSDPAFPGALSVGKAKTRATNTVSKGCIGAQSPQVNGYVFCPPPCDAAVPTIAGYGDVATCIACLADKRTSSEMDATYGSAAAPPLDAQKCQNRLGNAMRKYASTQQKEQQTCQFAEDQSPTGANCRLADPRSRVATALLKMNIAIDKCGTPTNEWASLTSCAGDAAGEKSCVKAQLDMLDDDLFDDVYNPAGTDGVFVSSSTGSAGGSGSVLSPLDTVGAGIARAVAQAKSNVFVDGGAYAETVSLATGVNVLGGFNSSIGWQRDGSVTSIFSPATAGVVGSFVSGVVLDQLDIHAASAASTGASSYGVRLEGSGSIVVKHCTITAGNGGAGANGSSGANGSPGGAGGNGGNGCEDSSIFCSSCSRPSGGFGGFGASCGGTFGGFGGGGGQPGKNTSSGNAGGVGGSGGGPAGSTGGGGSGFGGGASGNGGGGGGGFSGNPGADGAGGADFGGGAGFYASSDGGSGVTGSGGGGAGGGGGGGGGSSVCDSWGGGAGGGGGGGCGGQAATGGTGGGGSFGVWLSGGNATVANSTIHSGSGGNAGVGGTGGSGGAGGANGVGGGGEDDSGAGGPGGFGGAGGRGGHGGGGGGGPSIGISCVGGGTVASSANTFTLGSPGAGGSSPAHPGATGRSANQSGC